MSRRNRRDPTVYMTSREPIPPRKRTQCQHCHGWLDRRGSSYFRCSCPRPSLTAETVAVVDGLL